MLEKNQLRWLIWLSQPIARCLGCGFRFVVFVPRPDSRNKGSSDDQHSDDVSGVFD